MKSISIIGAGSTAKHFVDRYSNEFNIAVYDRKKYDLAVPLQCKQVAEACLASDNIIITAGKFMVDSNQTWTSNLVGPANVISALIDKGYKGHITVMGSHTAQWTSWPGIPLERLTYACAKQALSTYIASLSLAIDIPTFTVIEPPAFQTKMSGYRGWDVDTIVDAIYQSLQKKVERITLMRYNESIENKGTNNES